MVKKIKGHGPESAILATIAEAIAGLRGLGLVDEATALEFDRLTQSSRRDDDTTSL